MQMRCKVGDHVMDAPDCLALFALIAVPFVFLFFFSQIAVLGICVYFQCLEVPLSVIGRSDWPPELFCCKIIS